MNPRYESGVSLRLAGVLLGFALLAVPSAARAGAPPQDFITGGGWIDGTPTGARANFGVKGGVDANGVVSGHLNYVDHEDGLHVQSESVTEYLIVDETTRQITGTAGVDGASGVSFTLTLSDEGEPGSTDSFTLDLSTGYSASGTLQGGNIQLHTK